MGQQQLLLVILVTIIVGIATVVAINTFGSAADSATRDAVRQDLASIASSAQGYYMKPNMLGGGGRTFNGVSFNDVSIAGIRNSSTEVENENGVYTIPAGITGDNFVVTAIVKDSDSSEIQARVCVETVVMGTIGGGAPGDCPD